MPIFSSSMKICLQMLSTQLVQDIPHSQFSFPDHPSQELAVSKVDKEKTKSCSYFVPRLMKESHWKFMQIKEQKAQGRSTSRWCFNKYKICRQINGVTLGEDAHKHPSYNHQKWTWVQISLQIANHIISHEGQKKKPKVRERHQFFQ